jgi:hypothetical protein
LLRAGVAVVQTMAVEVAQVDCLLAFLVQLLEHKFGLLLVLAVLLAVVQVQEELEVIQF